MPWSTPHPNGERREWLLRSGNGSNHVGGEQNLLSLKVTETELNRGWGMGDGGWGMGVQASEDSSFKPSGGRLGENDMDYDADEKSMAALRWRLRHAQEMYSRYKTCVGGAPCTPLTARIPVCRNEGMSVHEV